MYSGNSAYKTARDTLQHQGIDAFTAQSHGSGAIITDSWSQTTTAMPSLADAMTFATDWNADRLRALQVGMDMYVAIQAHGGDEALIQYGLDYDDVKNAAQAQAINTQAPCSIYRLHARQGSMSFYPDPRELLETVQPTAPSP